MRSADTLNDADEESFDFEAAARLAKFILCAPLRRPKLFALLFIASLGASLFMGTRVSPSYRSETGILVQKSVTLPSFADTSRNQPNSDSDPVVGVSEAVKGVTAWSPWSTRRISSRASDPRRTSPAPRPTRRGTRSRSSSSPSST